MNKDLTAYVVQKYNGLSPKARRILQVILDADLPMTRNDIAFDLHQPRLYAHDLKLIEQLIEIRFVGAELRRRYHIELERNPEFRFVVENVQQVYGLQPKDLHWGKFDVMWEYWINGELSRLLRKLLRNAAKKRRTSRYKR